MVRITRRTFVAAAAGTGALLMNSLHAASSSPNDHVDEATEILAQAVDRGQVRSAALFVKAGDNQWSHVFGEAKTVEASFLLGSISKPIAIAALMTLYDQQMFDLDEPAQKYLPEFKGDERHRVTIRHLLTHTSGLPDQLPENAELRSSHATLEQFIEGAIQVPLLFPPGTKYEYSSMAILLAAEIAQRLTRINIKQLVQRTVLAPLQMRNSALGVGALTADQMMQCQVEFGAVESGGGSPDSKNWDWNSRFWRQLGAPWGGQHASAEDVGKFLHEFLHPSGKLFKPEVAQLMIRNHNPPGFESRGLGFDVGMEATCPGCSTSSFGHTGSTGTIAWADPQRDLICVVLTSLPAGAVAGNQHPRQQASDVLSRALF